MQTLITGATGYIGSALTEKLLSKGERLKILCRQKPSANLFSHPHVEIVQGDINQPESLRTAMKGCQQVYHLAAYARLWAKEPTTFYRVNVEGTKNVLNAAWEAGIEKMVYTSTAGVIGPSGERPMSEEDPRLTGFFNAYEETKHRAEELVRQQTIKGLPVTIVNPARVYGPGLDSGSNPVTRIMDLYLKGRWKVIPGSGDDRGSYCYIDDVVEGHLMAMEKGEIGARYLFGGENASFSYLMEEIQKHSGLNHKLYHIPFPVLTAASHVFRAWSALTGTPPMITPDWLRKYDYHWELDSRKAVQQLGYRIRPLTDGVKSTIAWLRANK